MGEPLLRVEHSRIGRGFAAIRDNEEAAECTGVPTVKLKLLATTVSGGLMGVAGAPFPYYLSFVDPGLAFNPSFPTRSARSGRSAPPPARETSPRRGPGSRRSA